MNQTFNSLISFAKSSQREGGREGVCLVSHIRRKKEIWFFRDGIRVQPGGFGEVTVSLCVWFPIRKMGLDNKAGVPDSLPAESKAALYFPVCFARVREQEASPLFTAHFQSPR